MFLVIRLFSWGVYYDVSLGSDFMHHYRGRWSFVQLVAMRDINPCNASLSLQVRGFAQASWSDKGLLHLDYS